VIVVIALGVLIGMLAFRAFPFIVHGMLILVGLHFLIGWP
jgi:hypothetical protein